MKKNYTTAAALLMSSLCNFSWAQDNSSTTPPAPMVPALNNSAPVVNAPHTQPLPPVQFLSSTDARLDAKEAEGVKLAQRWKSNPNKPYSSNDGSVVYFYGATLPTLVCSPLQVCSIRLEPGEIINDMQIGDSVRWRIHPALIGDPNGNRTTLITVKPTDSGLTTNLSVTTNRRAYTIKLASTKKQWMPMLSFDYPTDVKAALNNYQQQAAQAQYLNTNSSGQNIANLDFNYEISGDNPSWKPVRVYSDGLKTYIDFGNNIVDAPALVSKSSEGPQLINYRMVGNKYIVDAVIDEAMLIVGVGSDQTQVTIKHK